MAWLWLVLAGLLEVASSQFQRSTAASEFGQYVDRRGDNCGITHLRCGVVIGRPLHMVIGVLPRRRARPTAAD